MAVSAMLFLCRTFAPDHKLHQMKNLFFFFVSILFLSACSGKKDAPGGNFTVKGEIKNVPDQDVYLDQLFFSEQQPEVVDTAKMTGGKFELLGNAAEEGMFRIRLEKSESGFIFINDAEVIPFTADINDISLAGPEFSTRANSILKKFLLYMDGQRTAMLEGTAKLESLKTTKNNDSLVVEEEKRLVEREDGFKKYMIQFIDTVSDPVVAMFAIGYTRGIPASDLKQTIPQLSSRFPEHKGIASVVSQFNQYLNQPADNSASKPTSKPLVGDMAPEITLADTAGKAFSLSQLKGKYVLIDFWASWCGPCRNENPNVVDAYQTYKNKNFTVLGVSLDKDKADWLKAIKDDKLTWPHISDLQYWNSPVVNLYGFDGIPYNVLIDPTGKIIATELRAEGLKAKLAEVLK